MVLESKVNMGQVGYSQMIEPRREHTLRASMRSYQTDENPWVLKLSVVLLSDITFLLWFRGCSCQYLAWTRPEHDEGIFCCISQRSVSFHCDSVLRQNSDWRARCCRVDIFKVTELIRPRRKVTFDAHRNGSFSPLFPNGYSQTGSRAWEVEEAMLCHIPKTTETSWRRITLIDLIQARRLFAITSKYRACWEVCAAIYESAGWKRCICMQMVRRVKCLS